MKIFRKLVQMAIHAWEGYVCRKCGTQTNKVINGHGPCPKGGSHDWVWVSK